VPEKLRLAVALPFIAILLLGSTLAVLASTASYPAMYNQGILNYQDLKDVSQHHNSFVRSHKNHCGSEMSKSWSGKAKRAEASTKSLLKALSKLNSKQKKKKVYHDLVRALTLLKGWGQGQITSKLGTCKKMPSQSYNVTQAFVTVAIDLGLPPEY
jgi:hypothetical protein